MNTKILTSIALVIAGMLLGYGIATLHGKAGQTEHSQNTFFEFIDTVRADSGMDDLMSPPRIEVLFPEKDLFAFSYSTSQETTTYAVYDYKKDTLYQDIGYAAMAESNIPLAFVGDQKLLMYAENSDSPKPLENTTITITDFNKNIAKTLLTGVRIISPVRGDYEGKLTFSTIDMHNETKEYVLDTKTLDLVNASDVPIAQNNKIGVANLDPKLVKECNGMLASFDFVDEKSSDAFFLDCIEKGKAEVPDVPSSITEQTPTKFSGILEKVDTGCFADGECFVEVGGKHITLVLGRNRTVSGEIIGGDNSIGGLEAFIGKKVEVYANKLSERDYSLYGSADYFVKVN